MSKILNTKSKRIQGRLQIEYSIKDKEIKKSARHDKSSCGQYCNESGYCCRGEISTVYRLTKQL